MRQISSARVRDAALNVALPAPRAAYIHVPFCRHRCGYCNFTLVAGRDDLIEPYLEAIARELASLGAPREVDALYFGGGTPSHLSPSQFERLTQIVLRWHPLAEGFEWTVEANPIDVTPAMAGLFADLGVTRVSLGGQSFHDTKLRLLERDHSAAEIHRAAELARSAGLQLAMDLIFATPGESLSDWEADVDQALTLQPDHVSAYGLTIERGTAFWARRERREWIPLDEELERAMYAASIERLTAAGFEHYEVSNFALSGRRSRHNQVYWSGNGYFAAGPGAARYIDGVRETNHRSTTTYIRRMLAGESPVADRERLSDEARARELLVLSLRRIEGVSRHEFARRTGHEIDQLAGAQLTRFVELGLLADSGDRIRLTHEGLMVSDGMWPELL